MDNPNDLERWLCDQVIRLRLWGTDLIYVLSELNPCGSYIGASDECALRPTDQYIAPVHAELILEGGQWRIRVLGSTSELRRDGEPCSELLLSPGVDVQAYADDAIAELDAWSSCFSEDDCEWVMKNGSASLSEIEKATLRIVALNMTGSIHRAARRLRMADVSLSRWFHRREAAPYLAMDRNP